MIIFSNLSPINQRWWRGGGYNNLRIVSCPTSPQLLKPILRVQQPTVYVISKGYVAWAAVIRAIVSFFTSIYLFVMDVVRSDDWAMSAAALVWERGRRVSRLARARRVPTLFPAEGNEILCHKGVSTHHVSSHEFLDNYTTYCIWHLICCINELRDSACGTTRYAPCNPSILENYNQFVFI